MFINELTFCKLITKFSKLILINFFLRFNSVIESGLLNLWSKAHIAKSFVNKTIECNKCYSQTEAGQLDLKHAKSIIILLVYILSSSIAILI